MRWAGFAALASCGGPSAYSSASLLIVLLLVFKGTLATTEKQHTEPEADSSFNAARLHLDARSLTERRRSHAMACLDRACGELLVQKIRFEERKFADKEGPLE